MANPDVPLAAAPPDGPPADESPREPAAPPRPRRRLGRKLLLALGAFVLTCLGLELAASIFVAGQAPRRLRDGLYLDYVPLSTGIVHPRFENRPKDVTELLPTDKPAGQLRVFVFGESSVAGSPYGYHHSAPAQLHDLLVAQFPDRDWVVVNMGQPGSTIPNTYYHLQLIERFEPDFVIFFLGINDGPRFPGEECFAVEHPLLHGTWRFLVESLDFLWVARTYGPALLSSDSSKSVGATTYCDRPSFAFWADLVVRQATDLGAHVIVTTPVRSTAYAVEPLNAVPGQGDPFAARDATYRELLSCQLSEGCDWPARFAAEVANVQDATIRENLRSLAADLRDLAEAWRAPAAAYGARFVDLQGELARVSPGGLLLSHLLADEVHPTVAGYGFLARLWLAAIAEQLGTPLPGPPAPPTPDELTRYERASDQDPMRLNRSFLRRGWFLTIVPGLIDAATRCWERKCDGRAEAALALEWLRWRSGLLVPEPTPERRAELEAYGQRLSAGGE